MKYWSWMNYYTHIIYNRQHSVVSRGWFIENRLSLSANYNTNDNNTNRQQLTTTKINNNYGYIYHFYVFFKFSTNFLPAQFTQLTLITYILLRSAEQTFETYCASNTKYDIKVSGPLNLNFRAARLAPTKHVCIVSLVWGVNASS